MPEPTPLFRRQVVDARKVDWLGGVELATTRYGAAIASCAGLLLAGLTSLLLFGSYARIERVHGSLVPSAGLLVLSAPASGVVTHCFVSEGQLVEEGQVIARIDTVVDSAGAGDTQERVDEDLRRQQESLRSELAANEALAGERQKELAARARAASEQLALLGAQKDIKRRQAVGAHALLERLQALRDKGIVGSIEWNQREAAVAEAQAQVNAVALAEVEARRALATAQYDAHAWPASNAAERGVIERKLSDIASAIARNEAERAVLLRAPKSGTIAALTVVDGAKVAGGARIASLIPTGSHLQAELWVPSRAVAFVSNGLNVRLRYAAYPYQTFGIQRGRVVDVSRTALPAAEVPRNAGAIDEPMFRVIAALDADHLEAGGRRFDLRTDMMFDADLVLERQRLADWIASPLHSRVPRPEAAL
jgi:membrane fusion protein